MFIIIKENLTIRLDIYIQVKEMRVRGEEIARVMMSQSVDLLDPSVSPNKGFEYLMRLVCNLISCFYKKFVLLGIVLPAW